MFLVSSISLGCAVAVFSPPAKKGSIFRKWSTAGDTGELIHRTWLAFGFQGIGYVGKKDFVLIQLKMLQTGVRKAFTSHRQFILSYSNP